MKYQVQTEDRGLIPHLVESYGAEHAATQRWNAMFTGTAQEMHDAGIRGCPCGTGATEEAAVRDLLQRTNAESGTQLDRDNVDMPDPSTCPSCGHSNAMLHVWLPERDGYYNDEQCRDCGHIRKEQS